MLKFQWALLLLFLFHIFRLTQSVWNYRLFFFKNVFFKWGYCPMQVCGHRTVGFQLVCLY